MWTILLNKLKTLLDSNTLIQETYDYEMEGFKGSPVATITPSDNASEYSSTKENRRIYAFTIRLFVMRGGAITNQKCDSTMRNLTDSVLDDLDKNWNLSGISNPTGYQFLLLKAMPSQWGYAGREMEYRVAEIKIQCVVDVDTTLIT